MLSGAGLATGLAGVLGGAEIGAGWGRLVAAGGAVLSYVAIGPAVARFGLVAALSESPVLFGFSVVRLYALHAIFPVVFALVVGGLVIITAPWSFLSLWTAPLTAGVCVILVLVLRFYSASRRDLPVALLTPMESPVGDLSVLNVLIWQVRWPLLAAIGGVLLVTS